MDLVEVVVLVSRAARVYTHAPSKLMGVGPRNSVRDRASLSLSNAVVSRELPNKVSGSRSSEDVGIAHGPPRSLQCENSC